MQNIVLKIWEFWILHPKVLEFKFYILKCRTILIISPFVIFMLMCLLSAT